MKIQFTIHSVVPLSFTAEVANDNDAWRLLGILADGQKYPVSHKVLSRPPSGFPSVMGVPREA